MGLGVGGGACGRGRGDARVLSMLCVGAAGDAIAADEAPAAIGLRLGDAVRAVVPAPPSRRRPLEARREERVVETWRRGET